MKDIETRILEFVDGKNTIKEVPARQGHLFGYR